MKFDLSKFKKVHADAVSTKLKHPDGHVIEIKHQNLRPAIKKQLDALPLHQADGSKEGPVASPEDDSEDETQPQVAAPTQEPQGVTPSVNPVDVSEADKKFQALTSQMQGKPVFDPATGTQIFPSDPRYSQSLQSSALGQIRNEAQQQQDAKEAQVQAQVNQLKNQKLMAAKQLEQYQKAGVTPPKEIVDQASLQLPGEAQGQAQPEVSQFKNISFDQGLQQAPPAPQISPEQGYYNPATAQAAAAHENIKQLQALKDHLEKSSTTIQNDIAGVVDDIKNGHINPQDYLEHMGVGSKITTAIGLLLGGMGGGLTHQENPALKMLNMQMERNVQGQIANMQNKHNLMTALMGQYKNVQDATQVGMAIQNQLMASKFQEASAKASDPQQRMKALQMMQYYQDRANNLSQGVANRQGVRNASQAGGNPALMINYMTQTGMMPKEHSDAAFKELQNMQDMDSSRNEALDVFKQLAQINTVTGHLNPQTWKRVPSMMEPVVLKLARDASGRVNEYELPGIRKMFPAPGDNAETIQMKAKNLDAFTRQKMHAPILDAYNIHYRSNPMAQMAAPNQKVNAGYKTQ